MSCAALEDGQRFHEEQSLLSEPEGHFGLHTFLEVIPERYDEQYILKTMDQCESRELLPGKRPKGYKISDPSIRIGLWISENSLSS